MSTFLPKVEDIKREWYVLDAANKPLGRTAALAATLLRGKHKTIFAPNVDCGDHVVIINAAQAGPDRQQAPEQILPPSQRLGRAALRRSSTPPS